MLVLPDFADALLTDEIAALTTLLTGSFSFVIFLGADLVAVFLTNVGGMISWG